MANEKRTFAAPPVPAAPAPREVRAPLVATTAVGMARAGLPQVPHWDAGSAIDQGYYGSIWVHRCVRVIATALAQLPFRAGADATKQDQWNENAPLAKLLGPPPNGPNSQVAARRFWAWTVIQYLLTGRFCWEIERTRSRKDAPIVALWPLPARLITPVPTGSGTSFWREFRYNQSSPDRRTLQPWQTIYVWRPSPSDWRQPESVLQAARLPVSVQILLDRYDLAFLNNAAVPSTLVSTPLFAEDDERRAFRDQFRAEMTGTANAGRTIFNEVDPGDTSSSGNFLKVERLGLTAEEMDHNTKVNETIRAICVAFGVPLSLLGDSSERTFSNADQEYRNFWTSTMRDLIAEIQDEINLQLAPQLGDEVGWFDTSEVEALKPPSIFAPISPVDAVNGGLVEVNEWRHTVGLPPQEKPIPVPATPELPVPTGPTSDLPVETVTIPTPAPTGIPVGQRHRGPEHHHPVPTGHTNTPERLEAAEEALTGRHVAALRTPAADALRSLYAEQEKVVLYRLTGKRGRQMLRAPAPQVDAAHVFDQQHWAEQTSGKLAPIHAATVALIADRMYGRHPDADHPVGAAAAAQVLGAHRGRLAGDLVHTTFQGLAAQFRDGVTQGDPIEGLEGRVRQVFADATDQADQLAASEVAGAYDTALGAYAGAFDTGRSAPVSHATQALALVALGRLEVRDVTRHLELAS